MFGFLWVEVRAAALSRDKSDWKARGRIRHEEVATVACRCC